MDKSAKANVDPVRQRAQYTCMSASMTMCLRANGVLDIDEDKVNRVMGAEPMRGAAWEQALACSQYFGMRATLIVPATLRQLRAWTEACVPVMIAWNPEGRDWSHASVVYHVSEGPIVAPPPAATIEGEGPGLYVWVADPNIPNPDKTTRIVHEDLFYKKWFEKWPDYLVRRPALAIEREITPDGRQVVAAKKPQPVQPKKDDWSISGPAPARRNPVVQQMIERGPGGAGKHHTRDQDVEQGRSRKPKHRKDLRREVEASRVASRFLGEEE